MLLSVSGESPAEENIVQKLANASLLTTGGDLSEKDAIATGFVASAVNQIVK
jgi:hypothetical protein